MRPPVLPSGNLLVASKDGGHKRGASMRPPVLPSGNLIRGGLVQITGGASMRPPVLPSGNETVLTNSRTVPVGLQ